MINIKLLTKSYGHSDPILEDLSLDFPDTGLSVIYGESGSGKTTLLNAIAAVDKFNSGTITYPGDTSYNGKNIFALEKFKRNNVAYILQDFGIDESLTVEENILLAMKISENKVSSSSIDDILSSVALKNFNNRLASELSGGQLQRIAIARALAMNPKILLADEPTGNLDKENAERIFSILKDLSRDRLVIVVSHELALGEKYGTDLIELSEGAILSRKKQSGAAPLNRHEDEGNAEDIVNVKRRNYKFSVIKYFQRLFVFSRLKKFAVFAMLLSSILTACSLFTLGFLLDDNKRVFYSTANDYLALSLNEYENKYDELMNLAKNDDVAIISGNSNDFITTFSLLKENQIDSSANQLTTNKYETNISSLSILSNDDLLYGRMPLSRNEIVVDNYYFSNPQQNKIYQNFLLSQGYFSSKDLLSSYIISPKFPTKMKIVGIASHESLSVYVHNNLLYNIIGKSFPMYTKAEAVTLNLINSKDLVFNNKNDLYLHQVSAEDKIYGEITDGKLRLGVVKSDDTIFNVAGYYQPNNVNTAPFIVLQDDDAIKIASLAVAAFRYSATFRDAFIITAHKDNLKKLSSYTFIDSRDEVATNFVTLIPYIAVIVAAVSIYLLLLFMVIKSDLSGRKKEFGVLRILAQKRRKVLLKISLDNFVFASIFTIIPYLLSMSVMQFIAYSGNGFMMSTFYVVIGFVVILLINLLMTTLPAIKFIVKRPISLIRNSK